MYEFYSSACVICLLKNHIIRGMLDFYVLNRVMREFCLTGMVGMLPLLAAGVFRLREGYMRTTFTTMLTDALA